MMRSFLSTAAALFGVSGAGMLVSPASMLELVHLVGTPAAVFLLCTQGVALLTLAFVTWSARAHGQRALVGAVSGYLFLSSAVDLLGYQADIVGQASVPSAAARVVFGVVGLIALRRHANATRP